MDRFFFEPAEFYKYIAEQIETMSVLLAQHTEQLSSIEDKIDTMHAEQTEAQTKIDQATADLVQSNVDLKKSQE